MNITPKADIPWNTCCSAEPSEDDLTASYTARRGNAIAIFYSYVYFFLA
jgi:hypothetical protein